MESETTAPSERKRPLGSLLVRGFSFAVQLALIGAVVWLVRHWMATAPEPSRAGQEAPARRVATLPLIRSTTEVKAIGFGTVQAARELDLASEVNGRVEALPTPLEPGSFVPEGAVLFQIESTDFDLAVNLAAAELEQARADLEVERGRKEIAEREWALFGNSGAPKADPRQVGGGEESLRRALREPQLQRAAAAVAVAESRLAAARARLARCTVTAPFDAVVRAESLEVGRIVRPGDVLASIVGTAEFWVQATVPAAALEGARKSIGAAVPLERVMGASVSKSRVGRLSRVLPELSEEGRMGRVLIAIEDPLALKNQDEEVIPLGSYVRVHLPAGQKEAVYEIPRLALRENDRIYVLDRESRLAVRAAKIVWRGLDSVYAELDLKEKDQLITSWLPDALPGMRLVSEADPLESQTSAMGGAR